MSYVIRPNSVFTINLGGVQYVAGDTVTLTPEEFEQHKHKLQGVGATVSPSNLTNNNSGNSAGGTATVALATLPAGTWTPLPASGFSEDIDYKVLRDDGEEITDDLDNRRVGTSFEIYSAIAISNLTIEIEGKV